ncbi:MAG: hypothetical protein A2Z14_07040 [Chloroflexi bacterium RBG_16_48_8]|nr:MAG: hypothetical protein A2Z14_07040 [Chloroflexi bacterium RBG_16_48_8]
MENTSTNPLIIALLFVLRCIMPLAIMLGISYILRRYGLIRESTSQEEGSEEENHNNHDEGDSFHENT